MTKVLSHDQKFVGLFPGAPCFSFFKKTVILEQNNCLSWSSLVSIFSLSVPLSLLGAYNRTNSSATPLQRLAADVWMFKLLLLCILTSELVLHKPYAVFDAKTTYSVFFRRWNTGIFKYWLPTFECMPRFEWMFQTSACSNLGIV